ncbi:hypothetical protein FRC12_004592 [Ceratobasidium sp. 428]|nr:hypothetical protein FRC12_004592 [Ceratobasidium sp. 428]
MSFTYLKGRSILPLSRTDYDRHLRMDVSRPEDRVPDIGDVQGDAVYGMSKEAENFIFFRIENATLFKTKLRDFRPTSAADVSKHLHDIEKEKKEAAESEPKRAPKRVEYGAQWWQIGFTRMGLNLILDKPETSIGEDRFDKRRMRDDKTYLGDLSNWEKIFDTKFFDEEHGSAGNDQDALHGVIIVFEASEEKCKETSRKALDIFGSSIKEVGSIMGKNRPDQWRKHEHFGYMDGISQPVMRGVGEKAIKPYLDVDPGVIVIGHTGDSLLKKRPDWALSFRAVVGLCVSIYIYIYYLDRSRSHLRTSVRGEVGSNSRGPGPPSLRPRGSQGWAWHWTEGASARSVESGGVYGQRRREVTREGGRWEQK